MNKPLILVVEDDTPVRNLITTTLKAHDYRFLTAANGESGTFTPAIFFYNLINAISICSVGNICA